MSSPIVLSGLVSADTSDLLQGTRLQNAPSNGHMTFELQATTADATNNYTATLQMPNGDTPMNAVLVPGSNPALIGVIDDHQKLQYTGRVQQGGHVQLTLDETGTATMTYRITFTPDR